jgi:Zn finger protein HypA/HybF involved in hydrogenase expression
MNAMQAIAWSIRNHTLVKQAKRCGCYQCCKTFDSTEVKEWTYEEDTAICPLCGSESVIPNSNEENLKEIKKNLFA